MNPNHLDLTSLRIFVAVARTGSISAAAEAVSLSVPSVSKRVSELEATIGTAAFKRTPAGVQLTPAGYSLLQHALEIQQAVDRLAHDLSGFSQGLSGQVRLLTTSSAIVQGLPARLASFQAQCPGVRVELEERLSGDVVRALMERRADLGIFTENVPHAGLVVRPYDEDELVLIARAPHPIASVPTARLSDALQYDFISQYDSTVMNHMLLLAAVQSGKTLKLRSLVRGYDSVCRMVAAGLGLGLVPASFPLATAQYGQLVVVRLEDPWVRRRLLLGVREGDLTGATKALWDHLEAREVNPA